MSAVLLDDDLGALVAVLRGGEVPGADDVLPLGNVVQGVVQLGHVLGHTDLTWSYKLFMRIYLTLITRVP